LNKEHASEILRTISDRKIVVLGDVMLDEFIWGDVTRISPEAPVPVVDIRRESIHLGGAANVLANLIALGAKAALAKPAAPPDILSALPFASSQPSTPGAAGSG